MCEWISGSLSICKQHLYEGISPKTGRTPTVLEVTALLKLNLIFCHFLFVQKIWKATEMDIS